MFPFTSTGLGPAGWERVWMGKSGNGKEWGWERVGMGKSGDGKEWGWEREEMADDTPRFKNKPLGKVK